MYDDESVTLTRQIKDYTDVSTTYTDYTQNFQLPATDVNNNIFYNYFEENIKLGSWSPAYKLEARIEIGTIPIFYGVVELLDVTFANGLPKDYNIVFYGSGKNIMTIWGEQLLSDLTWSPFTHVINNANVLSSWNGTLLGGAIVWDLKDYGIGFTYSNSATTRNIKIGDGITFEDLRPSIRLKDAIEYCFTAIGYTLGGTLLSRPEFTNLYLTPMNSAGPFFDFSLPSFGNFTADNTGLFPMTLSTTALSTFQTLPIGSQIISNPDGSWNATTHEYIVPKNGDYNFEITWQIIGAATPILTLIIQVNGITKSTSSLQGSFWNPAFTQTTYYNLKKLSKGDVVKWIYVINQNSNILTTISGYGQQTRVNPVVQMKDAMPQIKISDFVNTFLKTYNAVLIPNGERGFLLNNLQDWYTSGVNKEYTKYIDFETITHKKQDVPSSVSMKHKEGESIAQSFFKRIYAREYGSVKFSPNVDFSSAPINIETLFSINPPTRINDINQIGTINFETDIDMPSIYDNDNKGIKQDLLLFYFQGPANHINPIRFGGTSYFRFPISASYSRTPSVASNYSLSFGLEDSASGSLPTKTIYFNFWNEFISRLYSSKSRIVIFKAYIPIREWLDMQLNDTIAVSGNYYKIQKISYDILKEIATMELTTYPKVNTLTVSGSTGKVPIYEQAIANPEGMTFLNGQGIIKNLLNATEYNGTMVTNALNYSNYNQSSNLRYEDMYQNYIGTISLNQIIIGKYTSFVKNVTPSFSAFDLNTQSNVGQESLYTPSLSTGSIIINQTGQYKISAVIIMHPTSSHDFAVSVLVNGLSTDAYSEIEANNIVTLNISCSMSIGETSIIEIGIQTLDGGSHNIDFNRVSLTVEKIL
jgi:hypothetical protein